LATPLPENSARFALGELLAAVGGRAIDIDTESEIEGISTDSRSVPAGGLFVALHGETHDGHRFAPQARERGAHVLVAADAPLAGPRIVVDDPLVALGEIARAHVDSLVSAHGPRPVLAIGGAAGKTTTRTLAAAAVEALFGPTLMTAGNLNNRIGVPMTLLTLVPRHRAVVLEFGTSERGEIATLAAIARPDVALVINVGIAHSAGLGGLDEIADEEAGLFSAARRAAVTSSEEPELLIRLERCEASEKVVYGGAESADVRLIERQLLPDARSRLVFELRARPDRETRERLELTTPLIGAHGAANIAAALAGALTLLARDPSPAEAERLAAALAAVEPVPGRMRPLEIGDLLVLDDAYNSNPRSLEASLAAASEAAGRRPDAGLLLALGDMLELGELTESAHDEMVAAADGLAARHLVFIGPESTAAAERTALVTPSSSFPDSHSAAAAIGGLIAPRDVVLVKGSRGTRTERLIGALAAEAGIRYDSRL
jgi:UDP-N-acetylmuramoyl-tripeptide--D-alanyl-D-alanine ligase